MKRAFAGTFPKEPAEPELNEDWLAFSDDGARLALSDGASTSYNSRLWARLLCETFLDDPKFKVGWLHSAITTYGAAHDFTGMSWSRQLAYERGCFATLLGIEHDRLHRRLDVLAIGDSVALLLDGSQLVEAWPFADPDRFAADPTLLSTLPHHNAFAQNVGFWGTSFKSLSLDGIANPILLCVTDALGEWALRGHRDGEPRLARLAAIASEEALARLVEEERTAKRMRVDDSTLAIITFD